MNSDDRVRADVRAQVKDMDFVELVEWLLEESGLDLMDPIAAEIALERASAISDDVVTTIAQIAGGTV